MRQLSLIALALLVSLIVACHATGNGNGNGNSNSNCKNIRQKRWDEMEACAVNYWRSQVFPRTQSLNQFVLNCMNEDISSAPFGIQTTNNKAETSSGWLKVSTNVVDAFGVNTGPFFENCTKSEILEVFSGCDDGGDPYVSVRVNRTFYYNLTTETFWTHYMSTFKYVKSSNRGCDPSTGAPDYTIIHYTYQPYVNPMLRHWPGTPISPDVNHIFYACEILRNRCGNDINWSPYPTCFEWVTNHPYSDEYLPVFVPNTGYCVFQIMFFGISYVPSQDPFINLCPFLSACTGNPPSSSARSLTAADQAAFSQFMMTASSDPSSLMNGRRSLAGM